jgi:hypothetical protein
VDADRRRIEPCQRLDRGLRPGGARQQPRAQGAEPRRTRHRRHPREGGRIGRAAAQMRGVAKSRIARQRRLLRQKARNRGGDGNGGVQPNARRGADQPGERRRRPRRPVGEPRRIGGGARQNRRLDRLDQRRDGKLRLDRRGDARVGVERIAPLPQADDQRIHRRARIAQVAQLRRFAQQARPVEAGLRDKTDGNLGLHQKRAGAHQGGIGLLAGGGFERALARKPLRPASIGEEPAQQARRRGDRPPDEGARRIDPVADAQRHLGMRTGRFPAQDRDASVRSGGGIAVEFEYARIRHETSAGIAKGRGHPIP